VWSDLGVNYILFTGLNLRGGNMRELRYRRWKMRYVNSCRGKMKS